MPSVADMMNMLGLRVEDAANVNFTDPVKLGALNNARIYTAQKMRKPYLTELQIVQETLTATSGQYALSSLTFDVLGGGQGIVDVKINGGKWCTEIDRKDIKIKENIFYDGTINNPVYYIFGNTIYVDNGQTNPVIDVYYYKVPTEMMYMATIGALAVPGKGGFIGDDDQGLSAVDGTYKGIGVYSVAQDSYHVVTDYVGATRTFTVEPDAPANFGSDEIMFITNDFDTLDIKPSATDTELKVVKCDLNVALHGIVVDLAEAECHAMDADIQRKDAADGMASLLITTLNDRYVEAEGIGTQGDYRRIG